MNISGILMVSGLVLFYSIHTCLMLREQINQRKTNAKNTRPNPQEDRGHED